MLRWAITTTLARQSGIAGNCRPVITKRFGCYHLIKTQGWSHLDLSLTAFIVYQWIEEPYMEMLTQKHSCTTLKDW